MKSLSLVEACRKANYDSLSSWENSLINRINQDPPSIPGVMGFGLWISTHINEDEQKILEAMESQFGEEWCNTWLCKTIVRSEFFSEGNEPDTVIQLVKT